MFTSRSWCPVAVFLTNSVNRSGLINTACYALVVYGNSITYETEILVERQARPLQTTEGKVGTACHAHEN